MRTDATELCNVLRQGLGQAEGLKGRCQIRVTGDFPIAVFVTFQASRVTVQEGECSAPDATLRIPQWLLTKVLTESSSVDFRDAAIAGNADISGDPRLVAAVARSLLRPREKVFATFRHAASLSESMELLEDVPRFMRLPAEQLRTSIRAGRPLIVLGCLDAWLREVPDLESLQLRFGDAPLMTSSAHESYTVDSLIRKIRERAGSSQFEPIYTHGTELPASMIAHFPPPYFRPEALTPAQIWLGAAPENTLVTGLHRDPLPGLLGQLIGRKRVLLCPPHHERFVYPLSSFNSYQPCAVNVAHPDYERFPELRQAHFTELVLSPGELLVTPAGWFHCVFAMDRLVMSISNFVLAA